MRTRKEPEGQGGFGRWIQVHKKYTLDGIRMSYEYQSKEFKCSKCGITFIINTDYSVNAKDNRICESCKHNKEVTNSADKA